MPEGPEVWILSKVCGLPCYGKHLFVGDKDWSFGLSGTVYIDDTNNLHKIERGDIPGNITPLDKSQYTGIDWMTATKEQLQSVVDLWAKTRKMLAGLLLDQKQIAGIGVAWGSEICHKALLDPGKKAFEQDLTNLVNAMIDIRNYVCNLYDTYALSVSKNIFINGWFYNLYQQRNMQVYKKGTIVHISGRKWYKISDAL
jgi:hypothetical protein